MWSQVPIVYDKHALWGISHWGQKHQQFYGFTVNRESARDVYSKHRILAVTKLKIVEWHNYKRLDWINYSRRNDDNFGCLTTNVYKKRCTQKACGNLQLGVESYLKKLNLTRPDTYRSDLKQKSPYTAYSNPKGFIYQNKDKKNRLMHIDELRKFSDGTLNDVRSALDDILKRIRIEYLPQTVWRSVDKERAGAIIQAIDRQLRNRRLNTSAGNPVKEILLKLNLPDHRSILTDSKVTLTKHGRMTKPYSSLRFIANCFNAGYLKMEVMQQSIKVKEFQRSFRHSDTERLSRSDEVLKLKNFKKDATLKLFKSTNQERYEHVGPEVTSSQDGETRLCLVDDLKVFKITFKTSSGS
ncbi:hypothetical protein Tco_1504971 [Tanacetum coccineum]